MSEKDLKRRTCIDSNFVMIACFDSKPKIQSNSKNMDITNCVVLLGVPLESCPANPTIIKVHNVDDNGAKTD
jgi:hypothetical protein